jgi:EAL domain-containing protein (putative c-di-GMP-specific phosphodiesterase class I)
MPIQDKLQCVGTNLRAGGVQTAEQLKQLKALDCDFTQGFFLGKPIEATEVTTHIIRRNLSS